MNNHKTHSMCIHNRNEFDTFLSELGYVVVDILNSLSGSNYVINILDSLNGPDYIIIDILSSLSELIDTIIVIRTYEWFRM